VLLEGAPDLAFPPLLQGRVYTDFRSQESYFVATFDLILSLYRVELRDPLAFELRLLVTNYFALKK
jgi:hypothetical protein